jgi:hypothetical protein
MKRLTPAEVAKLLLSGPLVHVTEITRQRCLPWVESPSDPQELRDIYHSAYAKDAAILIQANPEITVGYTPEEIAELAFPRVSKT